MILCDLHTHSNFSDGSFTPTRLVKKAEEIGLGAIALTDHSTTKGLSEFQNAGKNSNVKTINGIEFSTNHEGLELHIVALFIKESDFEKIEEYCLTDHLKKDESNKKLAKALFENGYDVTLEKVKEFSNAKKINRVHFAKYLLSKGYVKSMGEAFQTLLSEENGFYESFERIKSTDTISFIKSLGAVAIWAHPYASADKDFVEKVLPVFKNCGLDAIETIYPAYSKERLAHAQKMVSRFNLLQSGGSDFHGDGKPHIALGRGNNNIEVPFSFCESLYERSKA